MELTSVAVTLMRGGTSKGVYVRLADLPLAPADRARFALALLGSPDPMQLDGLGGTHSSTSKLMAVGTPDDARRLGFAADDDVDIAYLFAQVAVTEPIVEWRSNCGNLSAAVAPFAIHEGLVATTDPVTRVRMLNLNTGVRVTSTVPTLDGEPRTDGDFVVPGVPGSGARIDVAFHDLGGGTKPLLPTGTATDVLTVDGVAVEVTITHVNNATVFVRAASLGLLGSELPAALNADPDLLRRLEGLRGAAAVRLGLVTDPADARLQSPGTPRVILVSPPADHRLASGAEITRADSDLVARATSMGVVHHALPGTGLISVAVAAQLTGTVVASLAQVTGPDIRVAHPKGVVTVATELATGAGGPTVKTASIPRTARRLMSGTAYIRMAAGMASSA